MTKPIDVPSAQRAMVSAQSALRAAESAVAAAQKGFFELPTSVNQQAVLTATDTRGDARFAVSAAEDELQRLERAEEAIARAAAQAAPWLLAERDRVERSAVLRAQLAAIDVEAVEHLARVQGAHDRAQELGTKYGITAPLGVRASQGLALAARVVADHESGRARLATDRDAFVAVSAAANAGVPIFGAVEVLGARTAIDALFDGSLYDRLRVEQARREEEAERARDLREAAQAAARQIEREEMRKNGTYVGGRARGDRHEGA